jgi:hypothetical protein
LAEFPIERAADSIATMMFLPRSSVIIECERGGNADEYREQLEREL